LASQNLEKPSCGNCYPAEDRLYFKVDEVTRPGFERCGMEPFRPFGEDSAMGYYEVPEDVMEDVAQRESRMRNAIDVAAKAKRSMRLSFNEVS
jgi:TfoX/Sxy family transcriptional regulator of competence genes